MTGRSLFPTASSPEIGRLAAYLSSVEVAFSMQGNSPSLTLSSLTIVFLVAARLVSVAEASLTQGGSFSPTAQFPTTRHLVILLNSSAVVASSMAAYSPSLTVLSLVTVHPLEALAVVGASIIREAGSLSLTVLSPTIRLLIMGVVSSV